MKTNTHAVLLLALIASPIASFAQAESLTIAPESIQRVEAPIMTVASEKAYIRSVYAHINHNLSNYRKVVIGEGEAVGQSTEGALEVAYFDNANHMRKFEETYFDEMGKRELHYYFGDNGLCFVYERVYHYNSPMYVTKDRDGMQAFDINKSRIEEHRYYFYDDRMFEWINDKGDKVVPNSEAFLQKYEMLSSVSERYQ